MDLLAKFTWSGFFGMFVEQFHRSPIATLIGLFLVIFFFLIFGWMFYYNCIMSDAERDRLHRNIRRREERKLREKLDRKGESYYWDDDKD